MFERYTERARRVLFFSRYELSQLGGRTIETEHLLLALLRESKGGVGALFDHWNIPRAELRQQLEARAPRGERFSTSIEVPFSAATRRVLGLAAEEADRLLNPSVVPEHLLLGLLREKGSVAEASLAAHGMSVEGAREYIATHPSSTASGSRDTPTPSPAAAAHSLASIHIQRIMELVRDLEKAEPNSDKARDLVERIDDELMILGMLLQ
jgi:ATP-dependent Clp protease ATP-binding subunit ClpC